MQTIITLTSKFINYEKRKTTPFAAYNSSCGYF